MKVLMILALVMPTVLCRVVCDLKSDDTFEDLTTEELDEIQQLISLTQEQEEAKELFTIPHLTTEELDEIQQLISLTQEQEEAKELFTIPRSSSLSVTEDEVSFYVANRNNTDFQHVLFKEGQNITGHSSFNTELDTVFFIHGWQHTYNDTFPNIVIEAYLSVKDVNVVSVDWDTIASGLYAVAQPSVPQVGAYVGQFIQNISTSYNYSLDRISIVGHSLGAHIAGFAGKETNGSFASITGLDPAGPLYFQALPDLRLSEDDAQYVQSIHTDGTKLGVAFNVGHADYWPNGGFIQPGCVDSQCSHPMGASRLRGCAHGRSYEYFAESLSTNGSSFLAIECSSSILFAAGQCKDNSVVTMGGADYNATITGTYYLKTNSSSPYALGDAGI